MRVATSLLYDRAAHTMASLTGRADTLQTQIATGKRITAPSVDAAGYRQLTSLKRAAADDAQYAANIKLAASLLTSSDTALAAIEDQMQRASELVIQASSDTLNAEQKGVIAGQFDAIIEDIVRLANATDSRGNPLFSGTNNAVPFTLNADGTVTTNADSGVTTIPIGDGADIQATVSGRAVLKGVPTPTGSSSVFTILRSAADGLRAGTGVGTAGVDLAAATAKVVDTRASIGARGARLELESARLADVAVTREEARSGIEDVDVTAAITDLQKTLTVLQATQASFSKLTSLSLFDYLR